MCVVLSVRFLVCLCCVCVIVLRIVICMSIRLCVCVVGSRVCFFVCALSVVFSLFI